MASGKGRLMDPSQHMLVDDCSIWCLTSMTSGLGENTEDPADGKRPSWPSTLLPSSPIALACRLRQRWTSAKRPPSCSASSPLMTCTPPAARVISTSSASTGFVAVVLTEGQVSPPCTRDVRTGGRRWSIEVALTEGKAPPLCTCGVRIEGRRWSIGTKCRRQCLFSLGPVAQGNSPEEG